MKDIIFTVILVIELCYGYNTKLPWYIKRCSRSDPNFNECALKHGQEAIEHIVQGDPQYHIPSFTPFVINSVNLDAGRNLKIYITNLEIRGMEGSRLTECNWDFKKKIIGLSLYVPFINFKGTYNMDGRILIMDLSGSGPMNNSHYENDFVMEFEYSLKNHSNKEYMHIDIGRVDTKVKRVTLAYGNLLNNEQLSAQMNLFLNENWQILVEDLMPSINRIFSTVVKSFINNIMVKIPFVEIVAP